MFTCQNLAYYIGPVKQKNRKIAIIFLTYQFKHVFGCSKEPSNRGGPSEYPQHMFWLRKKKNNFQLRTLIRGPVITIFPLKMFSCSLDSPNLFIDDLISISFVVYNSKFIQVLLLRASVYISLVVTCWERDDLLALVCGVQL